jgi:hypothetical protein
MLGAAACAHQKAPDRLTSKIACQSAGSIASSGRPIWPRTPPALLTRIETAPLAPAASATSAWTALGR